MENEKRVSENGTEKIRNNDLVVQRVAATHEQQNISMVCVQQQQP